MPDVAPAAAVAAALKGTDKLYVIATAFMLQSGVSAPKFGSGQATSDTVEAARVLQVLQPVSHTCKVHNQHSRQTLLGRSYDATLQSRHKFKIWQACVLW